MHCIIFDRFTVLNGTKLSPLSIPKQLPKISQNAIIGHEKSELIFAGFSLGHTPS